MRRLESLVLSVAPRWLIHGLSRIKARMRDSAARRRLSPLVAELFPNSSAHHLLVANDDAVVFRVELGDDSPQILKVSTSAVSTEQNLGECEALHELEAMTELGDWRRHVAVVGERGEHAYGHWFTQSVVSGEPTSELPTDATVLIAAAVAAIEPVHRATARQVTVDERVLGEIVSEPLDTIKHWRPSLSQSLDATKAELRQRLAGRELVLCRQHGDYAPSNVLLDVATQSVSGIVDWKFATDLLPPEIDRVHYALSLLMQRRRVEYGDIVSDLLKPSPSAQALAAVQGAVETGPNSLDVRTSVTMAWLQHISFGLYKAHDLRGNPIWLTRNIDAVAKALH